jgi:hypothetical protein
VIGMEKWPDVEADVLHDVRLDKRNVRLIDVADSAQDADLVQDLFVNEGAINLVEQIVKLGLFTHELPIAVRENGKLVVVEGNRRIAAIKAIHNPHLAPSHLSRIRRLTEGFEGRDVLRRIRMKLAPSRDDADQLIAAIHTGQQRKPWSPQRQQQFFRSQMDAGKSFETLLTQFPTLPVREFVINGRMFNYFRDARYEDALLSDFINGRLLQSNGRTRRRFPLATLERLYENPKFQELATLRINQDTAGVSVDDPVVFNALAERIVLAIKSGRIDTRSLNKRENTEYKAFMDELATLVENLDRGPRPITSPPTGDEDGDTPAGDRRNPETKRGGGRGEGTGGQQPDTPKKPNGSSGSPGNGEPDKPAPKPPSRPSAYLDMSGLIVFSGYPHSIRTIFDELSGLSVQRFPNAALDLLRTFLEKTIKAYAERNGQSVARVSRTDGYVQLSDCLVWLDGYLSGSPQGSPHKRFVQVVKKINSGKLGKKGYISTKEHMDAINHNHEIFASPDDVRETWRMMKGLMELMLK